MNTNKLSKHFTFPSLFLFALPTIITMLFASLYTMVDGAFVSRLIGTDALSAVNIVYPLINLIIAVGIMLATGGSAVIATQMGEGKHRTAQENLSFLTVVGVGVGVAISVLGLIFLHPMLRMLGAEGHVYAYCYEYARMLLFFVVPSILQMLFGTFLVTAGKPGLGLAVSIAGGVVNVVLDYVFIAILDLGIAGAALATGLGYCVPCIGGLLYFFGNKRGTLRFVKPVFSWPVLAESCLNGSSEMVTNLSTAVVTYLFNLLMLRYLGADGVAAITIVLYTQYVLSAVYLGYSSGIAPVISYKHGAQDIPQMRHIFKTSMYFLGVSSVGTCVVALLMARPLVSVFALAGTNVYTLALHGYHLFVPCFLFMGLNIFASSFFTALSNGKVSAGLSFLRTFVFIVAAIVLLPMAIGVDGIWLAMPMAEFLAAFVSIWSLARNRSVYHYAKERHERAAWADVAAVEGKAKVDAAKPRRLMPKEQPPRA